MWTAVIAGAAAGLASVPHCTAMCGPLAAYACSGRPGASGQGRYQLGRFISYSALGGVAGAIGGATLAGGRLVTEMLAWIAVPPPSVMRTTSSSVPPRLVCW